MSGVSQKAASADSSRSAVPLHGAGADIPMLAVCFWLHCARPHANRRALPHPPNSSRCRRKRKKKGGEGGAEDRRGEKEERKEQQKREKATREDPEGGEKQCAGRPRLWKGRASPPGAAPRRPIKGPAGRGRAVAAAGPASGPGVESEGIAARSRRRLPSGPTAAAGRGGRRGRGDASRAAVGEVSHLYPLRLERAAQS